MEFAQPAKSQQPRYSVGGKRDTYDATGCSVQAVHSKPPENTMTHVPIQETHTLRKKYRCRCLQLHHLGCVLILLVLVSMPCCSGTGMMNLQIKSPAKHLAEQALQTLRLQMAGHNHSKQGQQQLARSATADKVSNRTWQVQSVHWVLREGQDSAIGLPTITGAGMYRRRVHMCEAHAEATTNHMPSAGLCTEPDNCGVPCSGHGS